MKKILILLLFTFLFFPNSANAQATPSGTLYPQLENGSFEFYANNNRAYATTALGRSTGTVATVLGFKWIPDNTYYVCGVDTYWNTSGSPQDYLTMKVYSGGTTMTNGTYYTQTTNSRWGGEMTNQMLKYSWYLGSGGIGLNCPVFEQGTTYWFGWQRSGGLSSVDYYNFHLAGGDNVTDVYNMSPNLTAIGNPPYAIFGSMYGYGSSTSGSLQFPTQISVPNLSCGYFQPVCDAITGSINWILGIFFPTQSQLASALNTLQTNIQSKSPFAYLYAVFGLDLSNPASGSALPHFVIPINPTVQLANTQPIVFDAQVPEQARDIFVWVRAFTTLLFWSGLVIFILNTARHIL